MCMYECVCMCWASNWVWGCCCRRRRRRCCCFFPWEFLNFGMQFHFNISYILFNCRGLKMDLNVFFSPVFFIIIIFFSAASFSVYISVSRDHERFQNIITINFNNFWYSLCFFVVVIVILLHSHSLCVFFFVWSVLCNDVLKLQI